MEKRRLLLIILFTLATIGIGILLYLVFFRRPAPVTPLGVTPPPGEQIPGQFPEAVPGEPVIPGKEEPGDLPVGQERPTAGLATQGPSIVPLSIKHLVEDNITGARLGSDNQLQFYNEIDGRFYKVGSDGTAQQLTNDVFYNVEAVTWSPQKNEAILEYPDGANIYYNFQTQKQTTLPRHWEEFSFSNQGDKIVAKSIGISPDNRWIVSTDPDGKNIQLVEPLGENADKVTIDWSPNRQIIGYSRTGEALGADREEILFVGLNNENYRSMTVEGRGMQSEWSPDGGQLLYSVYSARSDFKPELWIADARPNTIGENRSVLRVNTWADKCTFANTRFVYCGVPSQLEVGAGFAPSTAANTPDRLMKIDTQTGAQTEIDLGDGLHNIQDIFIDDAQKKLFFTDSFNSGLFDVTL